MPHRGKLAVIAGGGDLPKRLAEHARETGREVFVLGIRGFADPAFVAGFGGVEVSIAEIGKGIETLKAAHCREVVFAGTAKRPDFSALKLDAKGALLLPRLVIAAGKGDDALLRVVVGAYEDAGFRVVGADDLMADLLAPGGAFGAILPSQQHWKDIRLAAKAAAAIGAEDVGQGAIACEGSVLATEAEDGTDAMLMRLAAMRGPQHMRRGVLVKRPKPAQERRIDLPTIGAATVRAAAVAGLAGIAVEAGGTLVLNRTEVAQEADRLGLFVFGFAAGDAA